MAIIEQVVVAQFESSTVSRPSYGSLNGIAVDASVGLHASGQENHLHREVQKNSCQMHVASSVPELALN